MRHFFLLLLFFFASCCFGKLWSQDNQLTGVVTEIGSEPLAGANLMAKDGPEGNILTFTITDTKGSYQLRLPPGHDSLWVEVTHLT